MMYPNFIMVNRTAIRLSEESENHRTYYRDAGHWEIDVENQNGNLVILGPTWAIGRYSSISECTQDEWKEDNLGYIKPNVDYTKLKPKAVPDDEIPF